MTEFVYELSSNQDDPPPPRVRFEVKRYLAGLPTPSTTRDDSYEARLADPAFQWVDIPNVFAFYNSVDSLRSRFPAFQFDKSDSRGAVVASGKYAGNLGYRIRVRHNPHYVPTGT